MEMAAVLLIFSAFTIGFATFIENDFGTTAAKALVYNALWFELIIGLVFINLTINSIKIKPWKTKQWSVFLFHISFLFIILGAAVTRYVGYEGMMSIREGEKSNTFLSEKTFIMVKDANGNVLDKKDVLLSHVSEDEFELEFELNGQTYELETYDFVPSAVEYLDEGEDGKETIEIMRREGSDFKSYTVSKKEVLSLEGKKFGFDSKFAQDINLSYDGDQILINPSDTVEYFDMMTGLREKLSPGVNHPVKLQKLYSMGDFSWVFNKYYPHAQIAVTSSRAKGGSSVNAIHYKIENEMDEEVANGYVLGSSGYSAPKTVDLDDDQVIVSYGSELVELPFYIALRDFQLERYPASNSPSSYASEVTLIDESQDLTMDYRIYMNHVLDHRGYRFFQSSYDRDEKGTVLSVNHDYAGMLITYFGYGLMMLCMFLALFAKNSRFRAMMRKTSGAAVLVIALLVIPNYVDAQSSNKCLVEDIPQAQVDQLSQLLVQGHSGRFQPFNSVSSQVIRKFSRKTSFNGLDTDRILLGIMMNPDYWVQQEMIKVSNDELKKLIGNDSPRAKFTDFFDRTGGYKLSEYVEKAYQKKPAERGTFDKDIITVDERVNVFYLAMNKEFMKIFPIPNQPQKSWKTPSGPFGVYQGQDSAFVTSVLDFYLQSLRAGLESGNYADANLMLDGIRQFQDKYSPDQIANLKKMNFEIQYNKINIFDRLFAPYGILGFIMLILIFIRVMAPKYQMKWAVHSLAILVFISFIAHTLGLAARWYIAGHAPWSNGFESMIFIGWATVLSGLIFYKNSAISLASTSVLAALIVYVAHLSWMNPEITNLVPVLKSYWLTIHVAIITASYGFLALGSFMGFLNLIFFIFQTKSNKKRIHEKVMEITNINEMTMVIGLYLLTIGTFLGGIWANESWGRYWGWDPKETWALVTILVYAFILHMRYIPGLKSVYSLNLMSVLGYFSVLMTYFGVNYYLSGLHSYASGDPMPIPNFVYYAVAIIFITAAAAYYKYKKLWE